MKFTKMHGCGNDYVYVNLFEEKIADPAKVSIAVSDRHFGIGSDGLITIGPSDIADFRMRIYNADGSEAEMCGNGIRCVAKYVYDHKMTDKKEITIETGAGAKVVGTGRSDFPNQVNNVIAFPGIFRGALEAHATQITEEMKLAAAEALAALVSDEELNEDFIMPEAFDPRVAEVVSEAVKSHVR